MNGQQFVEVQVGRERYALPILAVHEIIRLQEITELPGSNAQVLGVINLRGQIISVVSLRRRFGLSEHDANKSTRIVVVNHGDGVVGMVVDAVNQVITFEDIRPAPDNASGVDTSYLQGMAQKDDQLVSVVNLESLLQGTLS